MIADMRMALVVCVEAAVPVIVWGPPGVGKSSVVRAVAAEVGLHLETVIASIREPSDFAGLPIRVGSSVSFAPPRWAQAVVDHGGGIVFYDEVSTAPPAVQAALLRPILDGVVGDLELPRTTRTIAAANPPDTSAGGWELSLPLANRFCHLEWDASPHEVARGLALGWEPEAAGAGAPGVHDEKGAVDTRASLGAIGAFLHTRPDLVVAVPTSDAHEGGFPTPRSWEMAGRLLAVARARACAPAVTRKLVAGCVGAGAAAELLYYLEHLDVPAPQDVLADPDGWEIPSQRGDVVYAVVASALSLAASLRTRESWEAAGVVLARIAEAGFVDVAYDASRTWIRERPDGALPATRTLLALQPLLADVRPARKPGP
jgi:hypothetical protein